MNKEKREFDDQGFRPHSNLDDSVNDAIVRGEVMGGIDLRDLEIGHGLKVKTKNREYIIEKRGSDDYYISGHPEHCPTPIKVMIAGSKFSFDGSMLKMHFIGRGNFLEYVHPELGVITTSEIVEIEEFDIGKK